MASQDALHEFVTWLDSLRLSHYKSAACAWWEQNGASSLEEVIEFHKQFADDLGLKALERKRLENAANDARCDRSFTQDLSDWLDSLNLSNYLDRCLNWSEDNGATTMEELLANWEDLAADLNLKPLELKRVEKSVFSRGCEAQPLKKLRREITMRSQPSSWSPPKREHVLSRGCEPQPLKKPQMEMTMRPKPSSSKQENIFVQQQQQQQPGRNPYSFVQQQQQGLDPSAQCLRLQQNKPLNLEIVEAITQELESAGGRLPLGKLAQKFEGVKRQQLDEFFPTSDTGVHGQVEVGLPGFDMSSEHPSQEFPPLTDEQIATITSHIQAASNGVAPFSRIAQQLKGIKKEQLKEHFELSNRKMSGKNRCYVALLASPLPCDATQRHDNDESGVGVKRKFS